MNQWSRKHLFWFLILLISALLVYRVYLLFFETDFQSVHGEQLQHIESQLANNPNYEFAVVGNINNSVGLFERKMIPMLNDDSVNFVVSAGNAVSGGGEDKYRALYRTLSNLNKPYLLSVGPNEVEALGAVHFYRHFGPFFYTMTKNNQFFAFLDATSPETFQFQLQWLKKRLQESNAKNRFVFISKPLWDIGDEPPVDFEDQYLAQDTASTDFKQGLQNLFERYAVDMVFSANLHLFDDHELNGVRYITTGGAGGLVLNDNTSYYHYVKIHVQGDQITLQEKPLNIGQDPIMKHLESIWFFIHSLFYVGHLNFLFIMAVLIMLTIKLYSLIFEEKDFYPNYDLDPTPFLNQSWRVAMFTNNYLPFIGGVPISIARLARGLASQGHQVGVFAPNYNDSQQTEQDQKTPSGLQHFRLPVWFGGDVHKPFSITNPFSGQLKQNLTAFKPDLIHVHHPFWLGRMGLFWGQRLKVPVVLTYHTRLEHYSHFVPLPGPVFRNIIVHSLIKRFANKCHAVIVPTASAEEYLRLIGVHTPIYVHPTGIEYQALQQADAQAVQQLQQRWQLNTDAPILISVARLSAEKNFTFMLNAIAKLKHITQQAFTCLIVGEGEQRQALQTQIDALGLTDNVKLVGKIPPAEMPALYQLGDIFVFASRSETQGMVILEAMAGGLPVVAVRASGIDDVIEQGQTGFKTPQTYQAWAQAVQTLLEDSTQRQTMGTNAQDFAKQFAIAPYTQRVAHTYAEILAYAAQQAKHQNKPKNN